MVALGGRWLRELAERCAYAAEVATHGGGPKHVARLEDMIREAAKEHDVHEHDLARAVAREWWKRGITTSAQLVTRELVG